jgi:hypothetical protein
MMRFKFFVLFLLFSLQLVAVAQDNPPLVIHIDGQIYRWSIGDAEPTFTGCDLQGNRVRMREYSLTQSADGAWAAFMVLPADMEDGAPTPTGNLWVCQVNTGEAYALSNRDPNFPNAVSEGVFSPDGSRIIWTEADNEVPTPLTATMFIHDFNTKTTEVLVEALPLDFYCGVGTGAPRVIWGEAGIVVGYSLMDPVNCDNSYEIGFAHYSEDGTLLNSFPVENTHFSIFEWLADEEPRLAYWGWGENISEPQLYTLNMVTGEVRAEDAALEAVIVNSDATAGSYLLVEPYSYNYPPQIKLPESEAVLETSTNVALSPDGSLMAILLGRTLYFGENGTLRPALWNQTYFPITDEGGGLDFPEYQMGQFEVAWANPGYRLVPLPDTVCPSVERLSLEYGGYVIEGLGNNNVRSAPDTNAETIGVLPEGAFVTVIDTYDFSSFQAPPVDVCSEGIRWREIFFEGQIGWTAEAQDDTYFLGTS